MAHPSAGLYAYFVSRSVDDFQLDSSKIDLFLVQHGIGLTYEYILSLSNEQFKEEVLKDFSGLYSDQQKEIMKKIKYLPPKKFYLDRFRRHQAEIEQILGAYKFSKIYTVEYVKNMSTKRYNQCVGLSDSLTREQKEELKRIMTLIHPEWFDSEIAEPYDELFDYLNSYINDYSNGASSPMDILEQIIDQVGGFQQIPEGSQEKPKKRKRRTKKEMEEALRREAQDTQEAEEAPTSSSLHTTVVNNSYPYLDLSTPILGFQVFETEPAFEHNHNMQQEKHKKKRQRKKKDAQEATQASSSSQPKPSEESDQQTDEAYYFEVNQKLIQSGITDTIHYIMDLDKKAFVKYKNESGFTNEQKDLITRSRQRAFTRERTRKLRRGPYTLPPKKVTFINKKYENDSQSFFLGDLDEELENAGFSVTAKEVAEMSPDEYLEYKNIGNFSDKKLEVLTYVRYRIKERKRRYMRSMNRDSPSFQSELQSFVQKLKKASIPETIDDIRAMSSEDFAKFVMTHHSDQNKTALLMDVWNMVNRERELNEQVQKILEENQLSTKYSVYALKKLNKVRYLKYTSPEYKEFTDAQKDAITECLSILRPKFLDDIDKEMERQFSAIEGCSFQEMLEKDGEDLD